MYTIRYAYIAEGISRKWNLWFEINLKFSFLSFPIYHIQYGDMSSNITAPTLVKETGYFLEFYWTNQD